MIADIGKEAVAGHEGGYEHNMRLEPAIFISRDA